MPTIDESLERVVAESPVHGPIMVNEIITLRAKSEELRTPLKDWDSKLAQKNKALEDRNKRIAALVSQIQTLSGGGVYAPLPCDDKRALNNEIFYHKSRATILRNALIVAEKYINDMNVGKYCEGLDIIREALYVDKTL